MIYLDNILIYSNNMSEHHWHIKKVLKCLCKAGIYAKAEKCEFYSKSVVLQTQVLKVRQVNEPCIGLTQENSIKNSVQDCLPYILQPHGLCYSTFSLP